MIRWKTFQIPQKNNMEGQKLLKVECGRYNQEKESSPNAAQAFSGCVKLCCMPQRFTSYPLHSKKKIHRLVRSCTLSTEKSQVSSQQCCCFCWLVGWSVLWLSRVMEGNSRHHFQTPNLPVQPEVQKKYTVAEEDLQDKSTLFAGFWLAFPVCQSAQDEKVDIRKRSYSP